MTRIHQRENDTAQDATSSRSGERAGFLRAVRALAMGDFNVRLDPSEGISEHVAESFNAFAEHLQSSALRTKTHTPSPPPATSDKSHPTSEDAFVGALSHEFRTPLNAILGWTQLLRSVELDSEKQVCALESIDRNAHMLALRLAEFLDAARIFVSVLAARKSESLEQPETDRSSAREGMDLP